jgi:1-acyl-sn-glycerol-3-phosphate acyltransferase
MEPKPLITPGAVDVFRRILSPLARYHRHSVNGLEHVPTEGGALLVVNHSLATYDGFLVAGQIYEHTGRLPTGLGDDMLFRFPVIAERMRAAGLRPASPTAGLQILTEGHLMFVAPGGMWESLRPSRERYTVRWSTRKGFCRLALKAGVPIILAACPRADDIYRIRASRLTDGIYHRLKTPLPIARGIGPTLLPRPVKLTHHIAPPLVPPPHEPDREDEQVDALHAAACRIMGELLTRR